MAAAVVALVAACGSGGAVDDDESAVGGAGEGYAVAASPDDLPGGNFPFGPLPGTPGGPAAGVSQPDGGGGGAGGGSTGGAGDTTGGTGGALCPGTPVVPAWTTPCNVGSCGACPKGGCDDTSACIGGTCGRCGSDADCGGGRSCSDGFCVAKALQRYELTVAKADWDAIVADPRARTEYPCSLTVDGTSYGTCVVRARGGSSLAYPKIGLRIELPSGGGSPGYSRKINLDSQYNDPSYLRDLLGYETFRALTAVPAPRARHVSLDVNGAPYGLMVEVERIGDAMLERWGRSSDASLYEADGPAELIAQGAASLVPLPPALYEQVFDKHNGTPGDYADLRTLIEDDIWSDWESSPGLLTGACHVRGAVDVGRYLDYLAVMALIQNHDSVRKNYYLSPQGTAGFARWEVYPWDLDLTFGCLWNESKDDGLCVGMEAQQTPYAGMVAEGTPVGYPAESFYNLLTHVVLSDPELHIGFVDRVCAMSASPFWTTDLPKLVDALATNIETAVAEDTRDRAESLGEFWDEVGAVQAFLTARTTYLRKTLGCK